jgi:hypothetical protein
MSAMLCAFVLSPLAAGEETSTLREIAAARGATCGVPAAQGY